VHRAPHAEAETVVSVEAIRKRYPARGGREVVTAVDGVSFEARRGEILGLLGPNGAGKTTTIKTICGLLRPDSGRVIVMGHDVVRRRLRALRHLSAVLEGNRNLYWRLTARENLHYFAGNRGLARRTIRAEADALLERFALADKADTQVNQLSRGMQQKLAIAVTMLAGSEILLLDEPTLGLDVETGHEVRALLKGIADEGRTVLISTHDMPVVQELCGRVVIVAGGRVLADERVANLLALFSTRAYAARLGAPLSSAQEGALRAAFPLVRPDDDGLGFRADLPHADDLYRLVDILRRERTPIVSLDRTTVAFEQVFRALVNGDAPTTPRAEGGPRAVA
jgi:ABC-2 type transport system ATP-binding protein